MSRLPVFPDAALRERRLARTWESLDPAFRTPNQVLGRRSTVGCVALEITQRCNLDCTLCYLSESSESVKDVPMEVIERRIDAIRQRYGPGVSVQVTGGDPTLRKRGELVEIVRLLSERGLGLRSSPTASAPRGTSWRSSRPRGSSTSRSTSTRRSAGRRIDGGDLNAVRREYLERARGLRIAVIFNTTIYAGNLEEVPALVRFFMHHSDVVGMASFQVQAETGRGEWRGRAEGVTPDAIAERVRRESAPSLAWDTALVGHPSCTAERCSRPSATGRSTS